MTRRRYFGTDGVRGVVGRDLTPELVERIGKAATLWAGAGTRVVIGRDTRGSGPELEDALARGIASAGGSAVLCGVVPTPAIALLADDVGTVVSASHNPPEYNGVKIFRAGRKLTDADELAIESLFDAEPNDGGSVETMTDAADRYVELVVERFGTDLTGLRIGVDCANGAFADIAPRVFERLGAEVHAIGVDPDGSNINVGCGATDLGALRALVLERGLDLGVAFDGDGDRMLAVDERGEALDGDQIVAILALATGVEHVAVTVMSNVGLHRLMAERGVQVTTTAVGDRHVLEALHEIGGELGGEQSGHIIWLRGHRTGDGLAAALLLCDAIRGRSLSEAADVLTLYPQVVRNVPVQRRELTDAITDEAARLNAELADTGRVLVRPSGTEPLVRVLAEARTEEEAEGLCGTLAQLVEQELG